MSSTEFFDLEGNPVSEVEVEETENEDEELRDKDIEDDDKAAKADDEKADGEDGEDDGGEDHEGDESEEGAEVLVDADDDKPDVDTLLAERDAAVARADELERKSQEDSVAQLKQHKEYSESMLEQITSGIKETRRAANKARDDGETEKALDLEDKLEELRESKGEVQKFLQDVDTKIEAGPAETKPASKPNSDRWIRQNPWFSKNAAARGAVMAIDEEMAKEGMKASDGASYYLELSKRVAKAGIQGVKVKTLDGKPVVLSQRKRGGTGKKPGGDSGRSAGATKKKGRRVTRLTGEMKENMRRFGLDPSNKEQAAAYLREASHSEQQST